MTRKHRPLDLADLWHIFQRRRWWVLGSSVTIIAATIGIVSRLPKIYRSETLIVVEPQTVPPDFVKPTVSTNVTDRLEMIREEVLSHSQLQRVIDQLDLYRNSDNRVIKALRLSRALTEEDKVELMQKDITVETIVNEDSREKAIGAFRISYEGTDPALVQQVTRQLASLFIEQNLKVREQQAEGTDEFIQTQLDNARQALETQEKRLDDFKGRNMGALPEQQAANLQFLGQLQMLMQSNADARARAQEQRTYLQSLLDATTQRPASEAQAADDTYLQTLRHQLLADEQKYKPGHPDIAYLKGQIEALERQRSGSVKSTPEPSSPSTEAADQLRGQMVALDNEIKARTGRQSELEDKVRTIQRQLNMLPAVEEALSKITRDYEISKDNYQSLLQKKDAAAMAAEMERRAKGEQFRIVDPASYPEKPYKPDVAQLTLLGCLAGVLGGCALGFFLDYKEAGIYDEKDAAFTLSLPALGCLPLIPALRTKRSLTSGLGQSTPAVPSSCLKQELAESPLQAREKAMPASAEAVEPGTKHTGPPLHPRSLAASLRTALQMTGMPEEDDFSASSNASAPSLPAQQSLSIDAAPQGFIMFGTSATDEEAIFAQEQFRIVRTRLLELMRARAIRTVMVTSAVEGEGKTVVAANLAFAMSKLQNFKVLLVDADLRKATLGALLETSVPAGLATYLQNGKRLHDVCWRIDDNLSVVPTARLKENAAELLNGERMRGFLQEASKQYDLVVVDAPPVLPVADAQVLTSLVDGAIMVVRAGACPSYLACGAVALLQPKVLGVVVNGVRSNRRQYYYKYY